MKRFPITRVAFRAWLRSHPRRRVVGLQRSFWYCPLGKYAFESGKPIQSISVVDDSGEGWITAGKAAAVLDLAERGAG